MKSDIIKIKLCKKIYSVNIFKKFDNNINNK